MDERGLECGLSGLRAVPSRARRHHVSNKSTSAAQVWSDVELLFHGLALAPPQPRTRQSAVTHPFDEMPARRSFSLEARLD